MGRLPLPALARILVGTCSLAVGCSSNGAGGDMPDGGLDARPSRDSGKPRDGGSGKDGDGDGSAKDAGGDARRSADAATDAPCNLATFAKDLIKNDTNAMALPSKDLGVGCTDDLDPSEFSAFFP